MKRSDKKHQRDQSPKKSLLTRRESEVLQMLIVGKSNKEIANEIYICEKTVEFHLTNIYSKIGVRTRIEAVIWGLQQK